MENLRDAIKERVRFYTELLKVLIVLSETMLIIGLILRLYLEIEELLRRLEK